MDPFVHLHVASAYSLRYGVARPDELAARAGGFGMDTLALTDRDGLYGAVKHVLACQRAGIRPIVGVDLAVRAGPGRVTLLATGPRGWAALCRLVSATHMAGQRGEPVTTPELIADHADGLVVLLGPLSDVGRAIADRRPGAAADRLARWRATCRPVIEIVDLLGPRESHQAARMLRLARDCQVPAVLTNQVRYLDAADAPVAQVLEAARKLVPLDRRHLERPSAQAYLKPGKEMIQVAERVCGPDRDAVTGLLAATRRLADECALDPYAVFGRAPDTGPASGPAAGPAGHLPEVRGEAMAMLRARCAAGMARRARTGRPAGPPEPWSAGNLTSAGSRMSAADHMGAADRTGAADRRMIARLEHELGIIERKGLAAYFLVVADVAELIRARGIRCAIRGSGAGCLVNYLLGIGDIDPLEHGLLMERFLADSRDGLPDIDLDVESARRLEAYRAIFDAYGDDRVACVSMMETYRARSAIRDVAAALGLPPHEIDVVAKAFPHVRARQIRAALTDLPELRSSGLGQARLAGVFRLAERLDGLPRHIALHPCGVLIGNATLLDRTPVETSFLGYPMSQFDKDDVEVMGMLKLDVIGIRMQSAMAHAVTEIARTERVRVDLDAVPRDDAPTYEMIRRARTLGCFQIESPGQRELVAKLEPREINDLVIDISLFRPGPVNADMVTPFLEARHGWRMPSYPHENLAPVLRESGGVVVFHEQVLKILDVMTGCGLSEAERARRLLAGEDGHAEVAEWFRAQARERGYSAATVERVWEVLAAFGAFGFCKAHAASFAIPTYQSAWLKRHHAAAFFAGVLTHDPGMYPKRAILDDARHFGIRVLSLDVNASAATWRAEPPTRAAGQPPGVAGWGLRVALSEVKGISDAEVARIVAGQPYTSLPDFWHRAGVSRPIAERIALVGGFDALYGIRIAGAPAVPAAPRAEPAGTRMTPAGTLAEPAGTPAEPAGTPADLAGTRAESSCSRAFSRRDLLALVGALDRAGIRYAAPGRAAAGARPGTSMQLPLGIVEEIPPGELPELTPAEAVETELEILGLDVSLHVLDFYAELLDALPVVRARDLLRCQAGSEVLVAGVKIATQTPAVRSGQRIIFATVEDGTGPVDATFFESVQHRCAATVFGSWLLAIRGKVRRTGRRAVSLNAEHCWDLVRLHEILRASGIEAARAHLRAAGEAPHGDAPRGDARRDRARGGHATGGRRIVYAGGFTLSPYADITPADGAVKHPPGKLWHASSGSSGGWTPDSRSG